MPRLCVALIALLIAGAFSLDAYARQTTLRSRAHTRPVSSKQLSHHRKVHKRHVARVRRARTHHGARRPHRARHGPHAAARPRLLARCGYSSQARRLLHSQSVYVLDVRTGTVLLERNANVVRPIASVSKLMTAIVARRAHRPLDGILRVTSLDRDTIKFTGSRLKVGARLSRRDMYHIALMSSENRAAAALSRDYPGGRRGFVAAMNRQARRLGMSHTHFVNPTGLSPHNVSTAADLARLVAAADRDPLIRRFSADKEEVVYPGEGELAYVNSNPLVRFGHWPVRVQKTGFINEAGHCVVIRVLAHGRPETIVLLGAPTRRDNILDTIQIGNWLKCSLT